MNMNRSLIIRWLLLGVILTTFAAASFGQVAVGISVRIGPPPLPVYAQPICPGPGYIWTPGYWAWNDDDGYYWVPGTWVVAPVGMLWTPGYWGWGGGVYLWHAGYWGPHVGFYGGINYGFGYTGVGFYGGEWRGRAFYYNRSVNNVSVTNVTNVYNRTVVVNENHVAFNGGRGGVMARPSAREESYAREPHRAALTTQVEHEHAAGRERQNFARENHGRPAIAATARPGDFNRHSVVSARAAGGEYHAPAISPREARVVSNGGNRGNSDRGNSNVGNRANSDRGNSNRGNSKEGFRPFTPPSKGGNANTNNRGGSNGGFRPSNAPSKGGNSNAERGGNSNPAARDANSNRGNQARSNQNRSNDTRPNENRGNPSRATQNRPNENRPQNQPREASRPNPPRENSRPSEPAKRQTAPPKEEKRHGK